MGVPLDPPQAAATEPPIVQVVPAFSPRIIVRTLFITVLFAISLYLVFLLRKPIGWVLIATFLAVALSGPVNVLNQWMRRGFAITIVYFGLLLIPIGIGALIVPPLVTQGNNLIQNLPEYAQDVQDFANKNERLRKIEAGLQHHREAAGAGREAARPDRRRGERARRHRPRRRQLALRAVHDPRADRVPARQRAHAGSTARSSCDQPGTPARMRTALDHMGKAVGAYVGGVIAQATLAAVLAYIVLAILGVAVRRRAGDRDLLRRPRAAGGRDDRRGRGCVDRTMCGYLFDRVPAEKKHRAAILGVPFAGALAIVIFFADLVPLVGATIGAVLVGVVTVFGDFPTATIVWVIYSIVYQQIENTLIQPQIQKRAVNVHPFIVLVAVLFGSTLLGVLGALVAIPIAASVQIAIREWWDYRHDQTVERPDRAGGADSRRRPRRRRPRSSSTARAAAAGQQAGEGGDPAADDEARDGRADDHLALVRPQLAAPVGRLGDLAAQRLDGDARARRGWPRSSAGSPPGCARRSSRASTFDGRGRRDGGRRRRRVRRGERLLDQLGLLDGHRRGGRRALLEEARGQEAGEAAEQEQRAGDGSGSRATGWRPRTSAISSAMKCRK